MTELTKVFGYLRVSSDEQARFGNGLNGQKGAIEDMCDKMGYRIEKFYIDGGVSGKNASRKGLDEMLSDLKTLNKNPIKPVIKFVMVDDIDRLSRDLEIRLAKKREIESTGAKILSLKQNIEDSAESRLMSNISMSVKQYERENNGRRVRDRQYQRMKDGYWVFVVPLGYKYEKAKDGHGKVVVPDEPAFSLISRGLKYLANGTFSSQMAFVRYLIDNGLKSKKGNRIYKSFVNHLIKPENLLLYAGFINYPKRDLHMIKGKHQAAISEAEFYKLTNKFRIKGFYKEYTQTEYNEKMPLRQLAKCPACNELLTGEVANGHGGKYFYYTCINKKCKQYRKLFSCYKLHDDVEKTLKALALDDQKIKELETILDKIKNNSDNHRLYRIANKNKELQTISDELDSLVNKLISSDSDIVSIKLNEKIKELENKKKLIEEELAETREGNEEKRVSDNFDKIKPILQDPFKYRELGNIKIKRLLIDAFFNGDLTYSKTEGSRTSHLSSIYLTLFPYFEKNPKQKIGGVRTSNIPVNYVINSSTAGMVGDIGLEPMTPCL